MIGRNGLVLVGLAVALAACGGNRPLPGVRYAAVSPVGEPVSAPTQDSASYRTAMRDWFNRTDTDRNGTLSAAEMAAEADRVFVLYDQNRDGAVTSAEMTQFRVSSPFHIPPADNGRRMRPRRIDMTPAEAESMEPGNRGRPSYRMGIDPVMSADSNADFRVTPEELRIEAQRRHGVMDKNGDKALTLPEFMDSAEGPMRAWGAQ